jgi:hypothetical protein
LIECFNSSHKKIDSSLLHKSNGKGSSSSHSLVGMVIPLVFGGIKLMKNDKPFDVNGLSSPLIGQKVYLQNNTQNATVVAFCIYSR